MFSLRTALVVLCVLILARGHLAAGDNQGSQLTPPISASQIERLNELVKKNTFKNICFEFSKVENTRILGESKTRPTAWSSGKVCLNGEPESLIKVSYTPATYTWVDGAAPYLQKNESYAYNGKYWIYALYNTGPMDSMVAYNVAEINEKCPIKWSYPRLDSGELFLLSHAPFFNKASLKKSLVELLKLPGFMRCLSVSEVGDSLKISIALPLAPAKADEITELWLDLSKGGALKKMVTKTHITESEDRQVIVEDTVENYQNAGGIWFPTKATHSFKCGARQLTCEFTAKNFSVIDDSTDLYELQLEPGTRVTDKRTNTVFVSGKSIDQNKRK